jgi:VCBS repeat-containing protein
MSNLPVPLGSDQAISNSQPSVALTYLIATEGIYPTSSGSAPSTTTSYIGEIIAFAGTGPALDNMLASGWAVANGQLLSISSNETLFTVLGTTYGGNGQTTFALPDLVGHSIAGVGTNNGTSVVLGQNYGSSGITLAPNQLPVTTTTVDTVHTAPTVTAGATATFAVGGAAVALDSSLTVSDADSGGNLTGATIAIGSGLVAGDTLNFTGQNGITGSYNASTGVLTLTGTDTLAHYQAALESITFSTGVANTGSRTIDWSVTDGSPGNGTSAIAASTVSVVQGGPQLNVGAPHVTFTGGGSAVVLDSGLIVTDTDSPTLVSATVAISGGFLAGDQLNFTNQNGIIGSYNSSTGVLTLTSSGASATLAQWETALQSVTFSEIGNADPTHGGSDTTRTISWSVNDGSSSNTGTSTLDTVHVAPVVTAGGAVTFTGGGSAVALDPTLTLADLDSGGTLAGATVSIDSTHFLADDTLNFVSQNGITGSYDAAQGVLTLSGTSSIANYQAALDSVTFSESSGNADPTGGGNDTTRTISWSVNDGSSTSNTATTGLSVDSSLATANPDSNHVLAGQAVTADAAHGVLANDTDTNPADHVVVSAVDGLSADVNQSVAGDYGSLTLHADGSFSYTASGAVTGVEFDTFTYTASNGHGAPTTSTLTIEVTGGNQNYVQVPAGGSATGGFGNTALDGSAGNATLTAATTFNAHQILIGGPGDTLNAASYGQDTFVFAGNFGHETINNFHPALDVIQLQQSQFGSLAAVMADIHQVGADSVLTLDASHVITITNTPHASLTAADFHLV